MLSTTHIVEVHAAYICSPRGELLDSYLGLWRAVEEARSQKFKHDFVMKLPTVSSVSAASLNVGLVKSYCQPSWQLRCVDTKGSHTWTRLRTDKMVKPDFEDRYNADKHNSSHLDIHPGLASSRTEMWLADLRGDEIMNMVSNLASTFSEIEDLQKLPAHKQCALVVEWLWKYGVPLNAPDSMTAKDIHEVFDGAFARRQFIGRSPQAASRFACGHRERDREVRNTVVDGARVLG